MTETTQKNAKRRGSGLDQDFMECCRQELDVRMQRSQLVGSSTRGAHKAALFHDRQEDKFTLLVKPGAEDEAILYDCRIRSHWERQAMVFGHKTKTGSFISAGHAHLQGKTLGIKLTNGFTFEMEVDDSAPHLQPFVLQGTQPVQLPVGDANKARDESTDQRITHPWRRNARGNRRRGQDEDRQAPRPDNGEDFTEEDLKRLRGEIPIGDRKRY